MRVKAHSLTVRVHLSIEHHLYPIMPIILFKKQTFVLDPNKFQWVLLDAMVPTAKINNNFDIDAGNTDLYTWRCSWSFFPDFS